MSFVKDLVDELKDEFTSVVEDGQSSSEFSGYIDTGCYMLNAILSGSIYGGVPDNKITAIAGESSTGKTFFALSIVKHFLDSDPTNVVVYYDTEAAVTKEIMKSRGIDTSRIILAEPTTIQNFRTHALKLLKAYEEKKNRPKMLIVLDSLGMLSTTKEIDDSSEGKETRDMTKAQLIKATFRVLTLRLAKLKVPMILTNHVYDAVGSFFPTKAISGGCLTAGHNVFTRKGYVPIESIQIGDLVYTKEGTFEEVIETFQFENKETIEIELENGQILKCTPDHKFYVNGEWKKASELNEGEVLETAS